MKRAISILNTMTAALKINETDWLLTTEHHARYFAFYAPLMKIWMKTEIPSSQPQCRSDPCPSGK
jgi:hypothetical protein